MFEGYSRHISGSKWRNMIVSTPLEGIRILSMAEQYPGPYATMILADLGADVILIERPEGGDPSRRFSGHFEALNRNKKSVAVDLKTQAGRDAVLQLTATADVFMEGFRPGVVARLGLGPKELLAVYPELIYVSISGFGQTGPLSQRAGHDLTIQGAAGLLQTPEDDKTPRMPALPLADLAAGMFAAIGTLAALIRRQRTKTGGHVDVSMFDALISWMGTRIASSLNELDPAPHPPDDPGYGIFATADGDFLTLSVAGEDHLWTSVCRVLGLDDEAQLVTEAREANSDELTSRLRQRMLKHSTSWLAERFASSGVPFGLVNDATALADDPQVLARGLVVRGTHNAGAGELRYVRQPVQFPGSDTPALNPAPCLGSHTREILSEVGIDVDDLLEEGVIREPQRNTDN